MKVAVVGSRNFNDRKRLNKVLNKIHKNENITVIVSGGAKGADILAEKWAVKNNIQTEIYLPDYEKYNRLAPLIRNTDIVNSCDMLLAFWDGESRGTKDSINKAEKFGREIRIESF